MQAFTIRELRDHTGELVCEAESGRLSGIPEHGQGIFVGVPLDESLLGQGVTVALGTRLFDEEAISLGKAARLAGMGVAQFMDHLGRLIPIARPGPDELEGEIGAFG